VAREAPSSAAGNLPATKFALPPSQAAIIVRDRLLEALDDGIRRPLTLISAPPGAGKTALLGSWIGAGRAPGPVAWLSLDAADADRRRFWRAVLEALARAGAGTSLAELAERRRGRPDVNALVAALEGREVPVVLALDDFHEVAEAVHPDIDELLHRPPHALRLVIATRADPPLRLGRLRLQDQLTELREPDLAMTLGETTEMLTAAGVSMSEAHVRRLWEHTEGWAGALRLAALPLRDHPDPGAFVEHFAGDDRAISDYLMSEVMSHMAPEDREFLLQTSIVTVLNGDLADALTAGEGGHRHLADLARGGVLLTPLDRRGEWYRYHALFRELLQAEQRSDSAALLPELHRRAAVWLAANGDDAAGLRHAVAAEAWDLAARLAGERWIDLLLRGEVGALRPLIERLPAERVDEDPEVALAIASALLDHGDYSEATKLLALAGTNAERVPAERRCRFNVSFSALQLYVARLRGDLAAAVETGHGLSHSGDLEAGMVGADVRSLALVNLGIAELWTGELDSAEHHLERARGAAAEAGHDWVVLIAIAHLALLAGTRYDYSRSAKHALEAIDMAAAHGWQRTWPAGAAYLALGCAQFLWDRGDEAAQTIELAREALAGTQERPLRATLALLRSGVLGDRGDIEAALAVIEAGAEELGDYPLLPELRDHFAIREAMLRGQLGDREQAARLMRGEAGKGPDTLRRAVVIAQFQLADGDGEDARETLAPWAAELTATPEGVQARVVEALARDSASDPDGAAESLELALDLAEPGGLRWALMQFGRPLQPLLSRQLRRGTAHRALVGDLLEALDGSNGRSRPNAPLVVEPLSPREQAVLRYLPTMMSNQEIASELFVSVNTVKTHLKAIYRKLDVADRREAVRRARRLELLAP
jgi:LuxR family transcriptional regulator, maltose regulon positive regulatory protein